MGEIELLLLTAGLGFGMSYLFASLKLRATLRTLEQLRAVNKSLQERTRFLQFERKISAEAKIKLHVALRRNRRLVKVMKSHARVIQRLQMEKAQDLDTAPLDAPEVRDGAHSGGFHGDDERAFAPGYTPESDAPRTKPEFIVGDESTQPMSA